MFTENQIEEFRLALNKIEAVFGKLEYTHTHNSAAIFNEIQSPSFYSRPGIAIYGFLPTRELQEKSGLIPSLELASEVVLIKKVLIGETVGYSNKYIAEKDITIALIPFGYGHGFPWALSNIGSFSINNNECKIVGSVCMDFTMVDITGLEVEIGDKVIIMGEGKGFEIAQGRLGPGRIHHCMRLIGAAQRALEAMSVRAEQRIAFGKPLSKQGSVREDIAKSYCEIEQARLLTLKAADRMDREGNKGAKDLIAMIKIVAPQMACTVIDRAMQIHGAAGLSQDYFLAQAYQMARSIRLADGPDQVHMMQLGRGVAAGYSAKALMKLRR